MPRIFLALAFLLLTTAARAEILGEYDLTSGPDACPDGTLHFIDTEDGKSRSLLFGGRHNWPMTMKNHSVVTETVPNGCHYKWACEKSADAVRCTTTLSRCPDPAHDSVIEERMEARGKAMTYTIRSKSHAFKCRYRKTAGN